MSKRHDNRYMEFRVGGLFYAVPLLSVKEVISKPEVTAVPNMPAHFEGMINLRGQILGVFNVRKRLAAKDSAHKNEAEVVIVIEQLGISVGMTVDEVTRVLHVDPQSIGPAPLKESDPAHLYIEAVIRTDRELVQTLNTVALLELEQYRGSLAAA